MWCDDDNVHCVWSIIYILSYLSSLIQFLLIVFRLWRVIEGIIVGCVYFPFLFVFPIVADDSIPLFACFFSGLMIIIKASPLKHIHA